MKQSALIKCIVVVLVTVSFVTGGRATSAADTPVLLFSTYFGGYSSDSGYDVALDDKGNIYLIGTTSSPDMPTTPGAYDRYYNGNQDAFIAKLSPDGSTLLYSTFLGGSGEEVGRDIAIDVEGNMYVTGHTYSADFPTTPGALDTGLSGGRDGFVVKLNAAGDELVYGTYLGGDDWDYGSCIAVDALGSAYAGGFTHGAFPVTAGAAQEAFGGLGDGFVAKLSPAGSALLYSTYLGGSSYESIAGIALDSAGNAYLASHTHSTDFPTTPGAYDRVCDNCGTNLSTDAAAAKLSADGSEFLYSTLVGGAHPERHESFQDVAVDGAGNAYFAGWTSSTDYPTTSGALQRAFQGGEYDAVVTKINADGSDLIYSTYLGGSGTDRAWSIVVDAGENAVVSGSTASTNLPTLSPLQPVNGGGYDAFLVQLDQSASALLYGTYWGGSGDEMGEAQPSLALDGTGDVYLAGSTSSWDLPTTERAYDVSFDGGMYEAFVARLNLTPVRARRFLPLIVK